MPCEDEIEDLPTSSTVSSYPETVNPLLVTAGPWTPLSPTMPLEPDALLPSAFAEYFLNQQSPALYDNGAFEQLFAVSPDSLSPDAADQAQREFSIVKDDADEERPAKKKRYILYCEGSQRDLVLDASSVRSKGITRLAKREK